ncbi:MAG: peroxiredoxin [Legionellales bacterium RIFCSPHIGHO2_12_FULL_42_9]|nr:MAG: peroxiredoxin [Legionellales bacterium RIFCSPHIGHO2_12_FULL_42_9]
MEIGKKVPPVQFKATNGLNTTFENYCGQWLIIYFYPKDETPGCTIEGCDFRDHEKEFSLLNATVMGVSRDSLSSHEKFKAKQNFPFELVSDSEEILCQLFDVIKMKSMYGKQVRGIERSSFIIDPNGVLQHVWRKVSVKDHVQEVLNELRTLQQTNGKG